MGHKVAGTTGLYLHVMRETFDRVDVILDQAFGDALHARFGRAGATRGAGATVVTEDSTSLARSRF